MSLVQRRTWSNTSNKFGVSWVQIDDADVLICQKLQVGEFMSTALRGLVAGSVALAIALGQTPSGFAQTPPTTAATAPEGENAGGLEEIVVTAEKRTEDVQKVPVVVAAVSSDEMQRVGAEQLKDIERAIPDLIINTQGSAVTMMVRGVYSTDTSPGSENAVAINLDGAYLPKTQGIGGLLFDVQRVEVAEGPQGTLYGRNANGGAINIITNKAVLGEDSASATLEGGNYELLHADAALNMSLGDDFAIRAAAHTLSHQGYFTGGQDDADEKGGRVGFTWKPSENESLWGTVDYATIGGNGAGINVTYATPNSHVYVPSDPRDNSYYSTIIDPVSGDISPTARTAVSKVDSQNNGATLQNDYDLGPAVWTTEVNWRKFEAYGYFINNLAEYLNPATGLEASGRNYNPQHFESESVETRLTSTSTTPLQWVVGVYGFHDEDGGTMIGYANLTTQSPSIQIANGCSGGGCNGEWAWSYAGFGQLTWTPVDNLHLTAGGRYTEDHKTVSGIFTQFGDLTFFPLYQTAPNVSKSWDKATYKAGISYDLTPKSMVYASTSTGYEAGGFAYGPGVVTSQGPIYAPETITAYEIGSKNRFLDDSLQVNVAAWVYKYKDYQTNLALFADAGPFAGGPPVLTATSAGQATYKGASIDVQYALTRSDLVKLNYSYLNARYGTFIAPAPTGYTTEAGIPGAPKNLSGQPISEVPQGDGTASYDHTFPLPKGSLDWQASANYKGTTLLDIEPEAGYGLVRDYQTAFALFNTSLRYSSDNSKWNVTIYCNNVANSVKLRGSAISTPGGEPGYYFASYLYDPRLFGIIFQAKIM
jgi:iron complex outermembrane receptor protein